MRRESRTLIEYVRGFSEPITKITLDLGFDDVPSVNCRVAIQKNSGLDYLSHHVLCYRGVFTPGKTKAREVATEVWAYWTARKIPVELNEHY